VIICSYNRTWLLDMAIKSVLSQTHKDFQLVIFDDNSDNPDTLNVLGGLNDPRIILLRSDISPGERMDRVRYAVLINKIVNDFTTAPYITFLGDDDIFFPHRLSALSRYLDEHSEVDLVYDKQVMSHIHADRRIVKVGIRYEEWVQEHHKHEIFKRCMLDQNQVMLRRKAFLAVRGFETAPGHWGAGDAVLWQKLIKNGCIFASVPILGDEHRTHPQSIQGRMLRGEKDLNGPTE